MIILQILCVLMLALLYPSGISEFQSGSLALQWLHQSVLTGKIFRIDTNQQFDTPIPSTKSGLKFLKLKIIDRRTLFRFEKTARCQNLYNCSTTRLCFGFKNLWITCQYRKSTIMDWQRVCRVQ